MKFFRRRTIWFVFTFILLLMLTALISVVRQINQDNLDHLLIDAIKGGDDTKAIRLLNAGANGNAADKPYTPLTLRSFLVRFLERLQGKAQLDTENYVTAMNFLYWHKEDGSACASDHANLVQALFDHGAALATTRKHKDPHLYDPVLLAAVQCGHVRTVQILLEHGVDPNPHDDHEAPICWGNYEIDRLLIQHGADVNAIESLTEYSPLLRAIEEHDVWYSGKDDHDTCLVKLLLDHNADTMVRAHNGLTPIEAALNTQTPDILKMVLEHGADPNEEIGYRYTRDPLIYCIQECPSGENVRLLLRYGAKAAHKDETGRTALFYAKQRREKAIIPLLLAAIKREQTNQRKTR